eukprot:gene6177-7407_t
MIIPNIQTEQSADAVVKGMLSSLSEAGLRVSEIDSLQSLDSTFKNIVDNFASFEAVSSPNKVFCSALDEFSHSDLGAQEGGVTHIHKRLASICGDLAKARDAYNERLQGKLRHRIGYITGGDTPADLRQRLSGAMRQYDKERARK